MPAWLGAILGVPALLLAAKAHGRQVRLEREAAGYHSAVFGGENPAFVEGLWRRDRIRFWSFVPLAALALGAAIWFLRPDLVATLVAALLWAPIAGFFFAGLWTWAARRGEGGAWWWLAAACATGASVLGGVASW